MTMLFPGGKPKALTLSYDDAVTQDGRLVEILNRHGIKCTFNLNAGLIGDGHTWTSKGVTIGRLKEEEAVGLYGGHEVAVHSYTHPHLEQLPKERVIAEIYEDRKALEGRFRYPVRGMAYPYGTYNQQVIEVLRGLGLEYARTVNSHGTFRLPENFLEWDPTCHHADPRTMDLAKNFLDADETTGPHLFYLWGHSYEFDIHDNWALIEDFCGIMAHRPELWYATNIEIVDYLNAVRNLRFSLDGSSVYNPSGMSVWLSLSGKTVEAGRGEITELGCGS